MITHVSGKLVEKSPTSVVIDCNGIGYFISDGVNFPFEEGLLLTSGDASRARGPNNNAMSEGTTTWPGDADLDAVVGTVTTNATFILKPICGRREVSGYG